MENSHLLVNLVFALAAAALGALLAVRLRQSVIIGYILAGIVIGPFTPGFVGDVSAVQCLADIGIIFLMFALGVQFSFRDLLGVGRVALLGGSAQVLLTIGLGYVVGNALGWRPIEALFFGAVISNSSSTVLGKVLSERGELDAEHGRIAMGWSAVQDLSTIVLVVVLSALATGGEGLLVDVFWGVAKATVFLALLAPLGALALPWLFERVAAFRNRELFIVVVAAVALSTALASALFGLSVALGAFVAGVVVGESDLSHQILGEITPLRDIFAGLFFVSVGMLVDPVFVLTHWPLVLVTLGLIVVAKGLLSAAITALFGYPVRTALLTGVALAQSAEFSFLLARVGTDLGVISAAVFSLMLAGAVASIVLAPALHQGAAPVARWLERQQPSRAWTRQSAAMIEPKQSLVAHAVICGYGGVGRVIGAALQRRGLPFVVIDEDPRVVRQLRADGIPALLGNAANRQLLERVNLSQARVLVVAMGDALAARQVVDYARQVNAHLDIVVRTHSAVEAQVLRGQGAAEAVLGELELALEMTRHTLRRFGISALEALSIVQGLRERVESGFPETSSR